MEFGLLQLDHKRDDSGWRSAEMKIEVGRGADGASVSKAWQPKMESPAAVGPQERAVGFLASGGKKMFHVEHFGHLGSPSSKRLSITART
jgi:hypothetical protein